MPIEPSKYASNQFEVATVGSFPLMSAILADARPKLAAAAAAHVELVAPLNLLDTVILDWETGETVLANAEALAPSRTLAFTDKMDSLQRKPDADTNSVLEEWDSTIRSQVAYQGTTYLYLLPSGRETLTADSLDERLDAGRDFGIRLGEQSAKPSLVSLGTTVTNFYSAARALRVKQGEALTAIDDARIAQELLRKEAAAALLNMVGAGLQVWKATPLMVDTLFDVNLMRGGTQTLPDAPADTFWAPATRTLSTTAMPSGATRLAAWREGPGGTPEQLAIGEPGALNVLVPANITFDVGELYQLWLAGVNSQGQSGPGPKQNWTAV